MHIKDSIAIVTGASAGIGLAVAKELSQRGAKVVLAARSADKLKELEAEIPGSLAVVTDMTKPEDIKRLVEKTKETFGRIDILVNNAGQGLMANLDRIKIDDFERIMNLNVFSVVRAMQDVLPTMREQGKGLILNVSSMVSKNAYPGLSAYSATKYALNAITFTARTELQPDGIVVCAFHPKMTATDFGTNALGATYESRAGRPGMVVDSAELVAQRIAEQIESEEMESMM